MAARNKIFQLEENIFSAPFQTWENRYLSLSTKQNLPHILLKHLLERKQRFTQKLRKASFLVAL